MSRLAIWDLPTRLFHWLVVALIPALWWTAKQEEMEIHMILGQVMLGLILFRIFWGLIGSSTARFSGFVRGPGAILAYLRGTAKPAIGHNPIGALSVLAMLLVLATQVGLGLFAFHDDLALQGPLAHLVSEETSETLTDRHETMFNVVLALIGLHLAAILFYLVVRRKNLVGPMVSGKGAAAPGAEALTPAPAWRFLLAASAAVGLTLWISSGL